jgi:hypothetical protein
MKGLYWNSRGLSDLANYRYIADAIKEGNLDFVAIMESGSKTCKDRTSVNFWEGQILFGITSPHGVDQEGFSS